MAIMEEHVYSMLAIEGTIEREEKQQPEPPPKYIQKAQTTTHRKRQDPGCPALRTGAVG